MNNLTPALWELATKECTPTQLRVLELRYRSGFSFRNIALTLDLDEATVRGHHTRALRRVRKAQQKAA